MEGTESKLPTQQEDSQTTIAETIASYTEFQDCVEDILKEIQKDEKFSEMTVENYDKKKSYLRKSLNEVSRLQTLLFDQHIHLIDEVSKYCPSLIKKNNLDSSDSSSKAPDEPVNAKKLLEESEFQKQLISELDLKIKRLEKELETSRKSLSIAKDTISILKSEQFSNKLVEENKMLKYELELSHNAVDTVSKQLNSQTETIHKCQNEVESYATELTERDDKIKKLKSKNEGYKSDVTRLEEIVKSKEEIHNHAVSKLKVQLKNQTKSFDDVKKQLANSRLERNRISCKLEEVEEEKSSKEKLIKEMETRLSALQVENERVVLSFEDAEKIQSELRLKVVELEKEVDTQMEVISVAREEKLEAIRQLTFSLDHYMTRYKQLLKSYAARKTGFFEYLCGLNTD